MPPTAPLEEDLRTDVCVVGAGIAGMSAAYLMAREGLSVAVLDRGAIGGGETGRTTAHLSNAVDDRYVEIERLHGPEGARICAESHTAAIDTIEKIVRDEGIECDFERVDGYLFQAPGGAELSLEDERDAARKAGLGDVEIVERAPLETFDTGPAIRFPRQAQFHPLKYLRGLAEAIVRRGGRIHTASAVIEVEPREDGADPPLRVHTEGGPAAAAAHVVVATNSPITTRVAIHAKQAPYRTYAIAARVPPGSIPHALYWDTLDPYHYVRVAPATAPGPREEVLIVGGEDRKPGDEEDDESRFEALEGWARARFPAIGEILHRWTGQVMEPIDGVAWIGRSPDDSPRVYLASGDSGMGMTHGTIAGLLLTDLVLGRGNRWASLYDPSRKTPGAAGQLLRDGADMVTTLAEWATGGEVESAAEISAGSGAIVRRGLRKLAVYRDPDGVIHERSAVCTHLGCIIAWNPIEKAWNCPCHGSRFDPYGRVLSAPAVKALDPS